MKNFKSQHQNPSIPNNDEIYLKSPNDPKSTSKITNKKIQLNVQDSH